MVPPGPPWHHPSVLFDPLTIGSLTLQNRILRSATHEGLADADGSPTARLAVRYAQLARGGVGAIVTGFAGVALAGKSVALNMLMLDRDERVPAHRALVEGVHAQGTTIIAQLAHCGPQTRRAATGAAPVAPSAMRSRAFPDEVARALTDGEVSEVVEAFAAAADRARAAGYDAVELHAGHGYLLSAFLSPRTNRRTDRWGGNTEGRARIVTEILARIRRRLGDFPVLVKLNGHDGRRGGMRVDEAVRVAQVLERAGCAAIEVSCGVYDDGFHTARCARLPAEAVFTWLHPFRAWPAPVRALGRVLLPLAMRPARPLHGYNVAAAARIRAAVQLPVIAVGGLRARAEMEAVLARGDADAVALCRPLIREPDLVARLRDGRQEASRCTECGHCVVAFELEPLRCHDGRVRSARPRAPALGDDQRGRQRSA